MSEVNGAEVEAKTMGWVPMDQFKGDESRWIDAETFLERGRTLMPILRKNNQELVAKIGARDGELAEVKTALKEATDGIAALKDFQASEVKRQVEERVRVLRGQLVAARKEGDEDLVALVEERLDEAKDKLKETKAAPPAPPPPAPSAKPVEPWAAEFAAANADWFPKDKRRTALFSVVADELYAEGHRGTELLNKAKEQMEATFSPAKRPGPDKAEGGGKGGGGGGPSGDAPALSFKDLPDDAKAFCQAESRKMVGQGKPFKTEAEWKTHYANVYLAT